MRTNTQHAGRAQAISALASGETRGVDVPDAATQRTVQIGRGVVGGQRERVGDGILSSLRTSL